MTRDSITARDWPYRDLETPLTGVLCWDETLAGPRPGILLVHGGGGLDEHARQQARRYAALGYVVFACDMLGDGVARDRDRVIGCLTALRDDPALLVRRARAGLAALAGCAGTDGPGTDGRVAAVGSSPVGPGASYAGRGCRSASTRHVPDLRHLPDGLGGERSETELGQAGHGPGPDAPASTCPPLARKPACPVPRHRVTYTTLG